MKLFLVNILFVSLCSGFGVFSEDWDEDGELWTKDYDQVYDYEEVKRHHATKMLRKVIEHNWEADQGMHTYRLEMNQFADPEIVEQAFTTGDYAPTFGGGRCNASLASMNPEVPESVDWRIKGAVTPVQNQGRINPSWAFSATGSLESQHFLKTGRLVKLSEQNLADCATADFSPYCEVGSVDCAFYYVIKNKGIDTEEGYPNSPVGGCRYSPEAIGATCSDCIDLPSGDEDALLRAVANIGPISVNINAGQTSFQLYKTGIYDDADCTPDKLNHATLVVGYGMENGIKYWIVKNSWGSNWGEKGYIRIVRGRNMCGIAARASYPVV